MIIYLVVGSWTDEYEGKATVLYGAFSLRQKADQIAQILKESIAKKGGDEVIEVKDIEVDEVTQEYYDELGW